MLQSMGLQRVEHDLATEQQPRQDESWGKKSKIVGVPLSDFLRTGDEDFLLLFSFLSSPAFFFFTPCNNF